MTAVDAHRQTGVTELGADQMRRSRPTRTPWRAIVRYALIGTCALVLFVMVDVSRHGGNNVVSLIQPGQDGPAAELISQDFPEVEPPEGFGLDGQLYYAIAADPVHLDHTSAYLDAPRYRLQRPLLSWAAWAIHPSGGGLGLVYALALVGLIGVAIGAVAVGALTTRWGGPAWSAALFPVLPGTLWALRVTVSDALALALTVAAIAFAARDRTVLAVAAGVLAVLAKEPTILILAGWSLHRRTRRDALVAVVPALVAAAWAIWLRVQLPPDPDRPSDIGAPAVGLFQAATELWAQGQELVGMACTVGGLGLGAIALWRRGLGHPLGWAIAIQLAFLSVMGSNPLGMNFGGTRMALPVTVLAGIALLTPNATAEPKLA